MLEPMILTVSVLADLATIVNVWPSYTISSRLRFQAGGNRMATVKITEDCDI